MKYIRKLIPLLLKFEKQYPAIILTGARQVGKTTLLRHTFPHHNYVSLDLPSIADSAENAPQEFFKNHPAPLIIDEVQYAPKVFRYLKQLIDQNPRLSGQFILTGSQKFVLMQEVSDSLAGRCVVLDLEGLSLAEIEEIEGQKNYPYYLTRGTYPALYNQPELETTPFFRSYLQTYIERDVRQIINIGSLRDFERFLRVLASRNGQILNKSEIARDTGITQVTANKWLSVLATSNQVTLLEPYFVNFGKRIVKNPKIYFNDTGLLCFLLGIEEETLLNSPFLGHIWEAFIFSEFRKIIQQQQTNTPIWYYRDLRQLEVDFLLENKGNLVPIELKWKENISASDEKNLSLFFDLVKKSKSLKQAQQKFLIARTNESFMTKNETKVMSPRDLHLIF